MAKAKKQPTDAASSSPTESTKKTGGKKGKKGAEATAQTNQPLMPIIDTQLAASAAAKLVARKDEVAAASAGHGESHAFKQMKENLHKPVGGNAPSFLQSLAPAKKFNNSIPGRNQQLGRNQTFGADVNRTGVPRRTGGG